MNALYLCLPDEPDLLWQSFSHSWLKSLQIDRLQIDYPAQPFYLHGIADESYDCVFISPELVKQVIRPALANWFRVLRGGGRLHLMQHGANPFVENAILYCTPLVESVDESSPHSTCLRKKTVLPKCLDLIRQAFLLQERNSHAEALSFYQQALLLHPQEFYVYQHLALYYEKQNWLPQAKEIGYMAAQQIPTSGAALMRFMVHLNQGDYVGGFQLRNAYCQQFMPKQRRCHAYPPPPDDLDGKYWQGEDLHDKTFVVWSEFGLGDEIMFAQLAHYLKHVAKVGKLIWVAQPPIVSLLQTHPDIDEVVSAKVAAYELKLFDYWTFPHDLLVHFRQPFAQMPKRLPYVSAQADKLAHFADLTRSDKKIKIGLAWRGDPTHENDAYRSIHQVNLLNVLLDVSPDIQFFCVQKELNDSERTWLAENQIPHFGDKLRDFADTAALLSNMDYVITVDTSIAHVAGALNLRTFVLLPYVYDWRWGTPLMKNLWYPNTEKCQLPQPSSEWQVALAQLKESLRELAQQ